MRALARPISTIPLCYGLYCRVADVRIEIYSAIARFPCDNMALVFRRSRHSQASLRPLPSPRRLYDYRLRLEHFNRRLGLLELAIIIMTNYTLINIKRDKIAAPLTPTGALHQTPV